MNDSLPALDVLPMARPEIGAREQELVAEVLSSGVLSLGPMLTRFERAVAEWTGATYASAVSSGTAGLHLAIRAAGIAPGDEVVTSPLSFIASANVMIYENATPVFADIDPVTLNIDPAKARAAVSSRTVGLLPVHLFGAAADMTAIEAIASDHHGLWIVEDACEAVGAIDADGRQVGTRGHSAVLGFYPNKQIATGEGGMVLIGDKQVKNRIDSERNQGRAPDMGWLDHENLGYNYRLSDVAAAIGVAQVEKLDEMLDARARVAGWYTELISELDGVTPPAADEGAARRSWFVYVVQLPQGIDRDEVIGRLKSEGVSSKPYMPVIHLQPFYREKFGYAPGDFPIAEDVAARSLALPFYPSMKRGEVERAVETLQRALS
ncbi:MAG: DegT/DnrJ/EryC1/StrS family aminotransferase [Thermoleophilaceae bacterium]|nr:DegT/DnrJ/EryC1/StrS family aminotransferase [Thermoleophilaceae bacterium]